jgi:beta-lactam-binding protein with PASTA domain/tRNA A-37 threonylcarbamoyl transferase component Bud32
VVAPHVTDRIGQVLGGRYRLVAPVGTGASASVFLGEDITLRRPVAVKVLHPALADDEAFLRRFRAEAQVAASLAHPNVVAVHDWGQDGVVPYLITEFLAGGNLRTMLDRSGTLSLAQVLVVGLEASRGLAYAHRRQLVHRDIKPANLLFDDEARLRIADFGLARALAEATWTEPQGAVLGTARYASPEQARGVALDGRSDVYALCLVLVEAATGTVPFAADTTLGTLMARVESPVPVPDALGPLAPLLRAAGSPDPADRPDADAFAAALLDAARHLERPAPLPLAGTAVGDPDAVVAEAFDDVDTDVGPPPPGPHDDTEVGVVPSSADGPTGVTLAAIPTAAMSTDAGPPLDVAGPASGAGLDTPAPLPGEPSAAGAWSPGAEAPGSADGLVVATRRRRWPVVVAVAALAALIGGGAWWAVSASAPAEVPDLVGVAVAVAESTAAESGWELRRTDVFDAEVPAGIVISQDPPAGATLADGAALTVVVSLGPPPVPLPDGVVGAALSEADARLVAVGLAVGAVTEVFDEEVPRGVVISAEVEPGTEVPFGEEVDLVVSAGPEPREVPDNLIGQAIDEVRRFLEALGLPLGSVTEAYSDTVPAGSVIRVPAAGTTVDRGTPISVEVSLGPPLVTVPDVLGDSVETAARALEALGLVVTDTLGSPTRPVTSTSPAVGTTVRKGSSITISTR